MPVRHFRYTKYDLIFIENLGGKIMDIKENISKDLKYIEETKEKLQEQYDNYFEQYNDDHGVDEEEFESDLAVVYDIMNMLAMDEKLPSVIYIEDLCIRLNMIENALNTLDSDKKSSKHNANKAFETCVSSIRQMKSRINEQIDEANKAIRMLDEYLEICNKYRK